MNWVELKQLWDAAFNAGYTADDSYELPSVIRDKAFLVWVKEKVSAPTP